MEIVPGTDPPYGLRQQTRDSDGLRQETRDSAALILMALAVIVIISVLGVTFA